MKKLTLFLALISASAFGQLRELKLKPDGTFLNGPITIDDGQLVVGGVPVNPNRPESFGAVGDGITDDTTAIQSALTAAGNAGGGTVHLGEKIYRVHGNLTVPPFVTLDGGAGPRHRTTALVGQIVEDPAESGAVLYLTGGAGGGANDTAAITMSHNGRLRGLGFYQPNQVAPTQPTPTAYPYAIRVTEYGCDIRDVDLINVYRGIELLAGRAHLENIKGNPLLMGINVDASLDVTHIQGVHFSVTWTGFSTPLGYWVYNYGTAFQFNRADQVEASHCFAHLYGTGLKLTSGSRGMSGGSPSFSLNGASYGTWIGGGFDNCRFGIYDEATGNLGWTFYGLRMLHYTNGDYVTQATGLGIDLGNAYRAAAGKTGLTTLIDGQFTGTGDKPINILGGTVTAHFCRYYGTATTFVYAADAYIDISLNHTDLEGANAYVVAGASTGRFRDNTATANRVRRKPTGSSSATVDIGDTLLVDRSTNDFTNTAGANSQILMNNSAADGQNVITSIINGAMRSKLRTDSSGVVNFVQAGALGTTGFNFWHNGDFSDGGAVTVSMTSAALKVLNGAQIENNGRLWKVGSGSPESVVTASVGSLFTRTDGGAGTTLYIKESGAGNTGWVAK